MKTRLTIIIGTIIGLLQSCGTYYYYPTKQNVLNFKEKGDINTSINISEASAINSIGYAFTNNIAFISTYTVFDRYNKASSMKFKIDDYVFDNEIILFKKIGMNIYPAINFGYGFGEIDRNSDILRASIQRQFIQPSIGYSWKYFEIAISTRISRVNHFINYRDISQHNYIYYSNHNNAPWENLGKEIEYFLEPSFTIGLGYKNTKLRFQYASAKPITNVDYSYIDNSITIYLNIILNRYRFINKLKRYF